MVNPTIIISVPHNQYLDSVGMFGESLSEPFAKDIYDHVILLPLNLNLYLVIFKTDYLLDQTSIKLRRSSFRQSIRNKFIYTMKDHRKTIHLDIHSFNPEEFPSQSTYELIVFINDDRMKETLTSLLLTTYLITNKVKVDVVSGQYNDIQDEGLDYGHTSIVFSINDTISLTQRSYISQKIVDWSLMIFKQ